MKIWGRVLLAMGTANAKVWRHGRACSVQRNGSTVGGRHGLAGTSENINYKIFF